MVFVPVFEIFISEDEKTWFFGYKKYEFFLKH
jgi:hypothetical protein